MTDIASPELYCKAPFTPAPDSNDIPPGFDPRKYPIISRHYFGMEPFRSVGAEASALVANLRFRNMMTVLLAMGDRPATEMVAELAVGHGLEAAIDQLLDKYIELDDSALGVVGGRDFLPPPLHEFR